MTQKEENKDLSFIYDGTLEGLFTCVFEAFAAKQIPRQILKQEIPSFFTEFYTVRTDTIKANRVLNGLRTKLSKSALNMLFVCWLSELKEMEMLIFNYIYKSFTAEQSIELNFADADVLSLSRICKKISSEAEKVRQFVRFQKTVDDTYFAVIEPLYNVLPLVSNFFENRFADQQWIIYDTKRKYGLYYDLQKTEIVYFDNLKVNTNGKLLPELLAQDECNFQHSWKEYLQALTIAERKNLKLQRQHMPKRFWKYLTEKQI
ncbi:MAG: TIGR03915 family putative DNA repair protein [Bacteroidales bacterium]|jgi:probable DNA metabolism protein|nr:TIGR03915 family putative DNA repair protein [Bacteroidales bacterium]